MKSERKKQKHPQLYPMVHIKGQHGSSQSRFDLPRVIGCPTESSTLFPHPLHVVLCFKGSLVHTLLGHMSNHISRDIIFNSSKVIALDEHHNPLNTLYSTNTRHFYNISSAALILNGVAQLCACNTYHRSANLCYLKEL